VANTITITDGTTTYNLLTATDYRLRYGGIASPPPPHVVTYAGSRTRDGQWPAFNRHENRTVDLMVMVEGTNIEDLADNFRNLQRMLDNATRYYASGGLAGARARLTVLLNGATNTTNYQILEGHVDSGDYATIVTTRSFVLLGSSVRLVCQPFGENTSDVSASASNRVANAIYLSLGAIGGDAPTPCKIVLAADGAGATRAMVSVRAIGDPANLVFLMEGETGTFTGYTTSDPSPASFDYTEQAAVGTASNDKFGRWTNVGTLVGLDGTPFIRVTITANYTDHYGQHRVFGRMKASGAHTVSLRLEAGATTTPGWTAKDTATYSLTTSWQMLDLGVIEWPGGPLTVAPTVNTLVMELKAGDILDTETIDVDYFLLLPIAAYCDVSWTTALSATDKVVFDGTAFPPSVYITDVNDIVKGATGFVPTRNSGTFPMLWPNPSTVNVLIGWLDDPASGTYSRTVDPTVTHKPRWHWLRGS